LAGESFALERANLKAKEPENFLNVLPAGKWCIAPPESLGILKAIYFSAPNHVLWYGKIGTSLLAKSMLVGKREKMHIEVF
jgi:hypothetical protein